MYLEYAYSWGGRFSRIAGGTRIGIRVFEVGVANSGTGPALHWAGVPFDFPSESGVDLPSMIETKVAEAREGWHCQLSSVYV